MLSSTLLLEVDAVNRQMQPVVLLLGGLERNFHRCMILLTAFLKHTGHETRVVGYSRLRL